MYFLNFYIFCFFFINKGNILSFILLLYSIRLFGIGSQGNSGNFTDFEELHKIKEIKHQINIYEIKKMICISSRITM